MTGRFTATASMRVARARAIAVVLRTGRVLVAGGASTGARTSATRTVELYDPATGRWTPTGSMHVARRDFAAASLPGGRVLVAGGATTSGTTRTAEVYDPTTGRWTRTGSLAVARQAHTATPVRTRASFTGRAAGRAPTSGVLVAGGRRGGAPLAGTEVFDPTAGRWRPAGDLHQARSGQSATRLSDGRVLVAGGDGGSGALRSVEVFSPARGRWTVSGPLRVPAEAAGAAVLPSGQVLIAGGRGRDGRPTAAAQVLDPRTRAWSRAASLGTARTGNPLTVLNDGTVLTSGGPGASAERFGYAPQLPADFRGRGRYIVRDLGVDVPFTWEGRDGDSQMVAGGPNHPIHFTNIVANDTLYTLTYKWPNVNSHPCVALFAGTFTRELFNDWLAGSRYVGPEIIDRARRRYVNHFRSGVVLPPAPPGNFGRLGFILGDFYVDQADSSTFWRVLHFGVQNLLDPELDEWIEMDTFSREPGTVRLPARCPRPPPG